MAAKPALSDAAIARLLLVTLSFCWGLSWTAMRVALYEVSPWTLRFIGYTIGAATLAFWLKVQGRSLAIPGGRNAVHVFNVALLIVVSFGVAGTFAQLMANISRVIVVNYSMPVWGSMMAYFVLHERINRRTAIGLVLCVVGLAVLVYPTAEKSIEEPLGLLLAFCCALGWGAGTVYMKWAPLKGDLMAITFWQLMIGVVFFGGAYLVFEGAPKIKSLRWQTWAGLLYNGVLGTGVAYVVWLSIVGRLSTAMASLGALLSPVVGVIGAIIFLGDRPTVSDIIGFALILGAAACVLLPQRTKPPVLPTP